MIKSNRHHHVQQFLLIYWTDKILFMAVLYPCVYMHVMHACTHTHTHIYMSVHVCIYRKLLSISPPHSISPPPTLRQKLCKRWNTLYKPTPYFSFNFDFFPNPFVYPKESRHRFRRGIKHWNTLNEHVIQAHGLRMLAFIPMVHC